MKTVFVSDNTDAVRRVFHTEERVFTKADMEENKEYFSDTEFIFSTWGMPVLSKEEIKDLLPNLKAVFYGAGSVQYFARPFLECGVKVFSAWAANAVPVAEYTVAQILLANKGFFKTMRYTNRESANETLANFRGNYDVKVGIIGAGMIGKLVIGKLKEYDVETLVYDPFLPDETAEALGVKKVSLEKLFEECDVVSNHLADNAETRGMLHGGLFERMLPYSTFINTGRGAQVVEPDLIRVLKNRPDLTAILDVTYPEPPEEGSKLYTLENCILTPHIAGSTGREVRRMGDYMRAEYENFVSGKPCKY
ncbi:MAG: hydroxyacid dehydrogenase, partial [Oscillospiraceae bacterium]|nr:hydroxyacid dehydrogenase [Oscillospiraceae bacterium]